MHRASPASQGSSPLISLSIVSHGDGTSLQLLLKSLAAHEQIAQLELLITDNLGHDLGDVPSKGWHSLSMWRPRRPRGFAANHNAAFGVASGRYFCVLNPDVVFEESVFLPLLEHLRRGEGHIVAPILLDSRGRLQDSFRGLPSPWELVARRLGGVRAISLPEGDALLHPDWIAGMFMLMERATFQGLGGFDPRYQLYFEDVDLCTRARLAGLKILVDGTLHLRHDPRHASRRTGRHLLWHILSALRFFASETYRRAQRARANA